MQSSRFRVTMVGDTHLDPDGGYDGSDLILPPTDLILGMGDWVNWGTNEEYAAAIRWARTLRVPFILVRGNHDNGAWARHARQVCAPEMAIQLEAHSPVDRMGMTEWKPMIWEKVENTAVYLPKQTAWHRVPAEVQSHIVLLLDVTPAYHAFEAGGMLFLCLDTCNWWLGTEQMQWLESQVAAADRPVVLVAHHHFLPVGIVYDTCQVHERDFLRNLVLSHSKIVAFLHGHAHLDRWWSYGGKDILAVRNRAVRQVTFEAGRVVESLLDGEPTATEVFHPRYLCAQCESPGQVSYMTCTEFSNPWGKATTPCLGWLPPEEEPIELVWSMRLPSALSEADHELRFQVRNAGRCELSVTAPGLPESRTLTLRAAPAGQTVAMPLGPLEEGLIEARLRCTSGWGYAAMPAELVPTPGAASAH